MTVTVIRMDQRRVDDIDYPYTQYCIVNTEMNAREFKAYCQIYNLYMTNSRLWYWMPVRKSTFNHFAKNMKWSMKYETCTSLLQHSAW